MKLTKVTNIQVTATPGAELHACMHKAMCLSVKRLVDVTLVHNGKEYNFFADDFRDSLRKAVRQ